MFRGRSDRSATPSLRFDVARPFPPPLAMDQGELRRTRRSAKSAKAGRAASVAGLKAPRYTDLENALEPQVGERAYVPDATAEPRLSHLACVFTARVDSRSRRVDACLASCYR